MRTACLTVLLLLSLLVDAAVADVLPRPLQIPDDAAPTFSVFTSREGLSDEIWSAVGVDADGFVWAGSASSLARFDGYRWTIWPFPQARSLVRDFQRDGDGHLWALFEREGLARYDGRRWTLIGKAGVGERFSVVERRGGPREYWLAHDQELAQLRNGQWQDGVSGWSASASRPAVMTRTESLFGGPRQWVGTTSDGLWYRQLSPTPGPWTHFAHAGVLGSVRGVLRSEEAGVEELWVAGAEGLARIRGDQVRLWSASRGEVPTNAMYSIVETHNASGERTLWAATRAGLLRLRGDHVDVFDRRQGLPSDAIRGLAVQHSRDGADVLWLATEGGIARADLTDTPWRAASRFGARDNGALGLLLEPDGRGGERLWIGSSGDGLALLEDGRWRYFTRASGDLPVESVRGIWRLPDASGRYRRLLGLYNAGLLEITDDLKIVPFASPWKPHPENTAMGALARTYDGALEWWVVTRRSGAYRWRRGTWTNYTLPDSPQQPWPAYAITEQIDRAGTSWLWTAGTRGLALFDGRQWLPPPASLGLPDDTFTSVTLFDETDRQELWVGTLHHGVLRLEVSDPRQPRLIQDATLPLPPDPTVYSVLRDKQRRIYLCTNNGVQQLTPAAPVGYRERVFHRRDGLVHDECNQGSEVIDVHDRYWVGTLGGLAMFDPDTAPPAAVVRPQALRFTQLQADAQIQLLPGDDPLDLPADVRELRVEYALLSGTRESETRYRSQLLGYDRTPTAWGSDRARGFTHLPPGAYELRVEARDYRDAVSSTASLAFSIAPHWYQRRWLQACLAVLVLMIASGAALTYVRRVRARQRWLQEEVAHRTAELHEANAQLTELSYVDPLTGVANRRRLMEALTIAIERARERQRPIGLSILDVDFFKDYNDRYGHLAGDAALRAVAQTISEATRPQDLIARFGGEEFACLMVDADLAVVERIAERMRTTVETLPPRRLGNDNQRITISTGVLCRVPGPGEGAEDLLLAADAALYEAKRRGRNRLVVAG